MKNAIALLCLLLSVAACKNKSEEVEVDETKIENPADSIVQKDTVAINEAEVDTKIIEAETEKPEPTESKVQDKASYATFGSKFTADKVLSKDEMLKKYKAMKAGDTVAVKFKSTIREVCKKKGCWMSMELPNNKESFVRFKDYGFFVPLNADNSEAIINGRAFIDVVSVAELQHYAKDGGKTQEEIDKITEPKITYAFQADGVQIKQ